MVMFDETKFVNDAWRAIAGGVPLSDEKLIRVNDLAWWEYNGPTRVYHETSHIFSCLQQAEQYQLAPSGILALFYHDIVYIPGYDGNEKASVTWFLNDFRFLLGNLNVNANPICDFIRATSHQATPENETEALVCDIDMSILASEPHLFDAYDREIKEEFCMYSDADYKVGRRAFLEKLLAKPIFYSRQFVEGGFEKKARENIQRRLEKET